MSALSSRTERLPRTSPEPSRHFLNRCGAALDPLVNVAAAHCSATRLERVGTASGPIAAAAQRLASRCRSAWPGWKRRGGRRDMLARRAVGAMSRAVRPRRAPSSSLFGSMLWFSFRGSAARAPSPSCPAICPPPPSARPARRRLRRGFRGRFRRAVPRISFPRHLQGRPARRRQRARWRPMGRPGGAREPWRSAANGSRPVEAAPSAAPAATEAARPRQISSPRWQARRLEMHRRGGLGAGRSLVPYEFI